jgi:ribosomal protein S27AE
LTSSADRQHCDKCGATCLDGVARVRVVRTGTAAGVVTYLLCLRCGDRLAEHLSRAAAALNGTR